MRVSLRSVLAGGAAMLVVAALTPAMAADGQVHVMTVQLPGGGVERIQYTGDVAPRVVLVPVQSVAVPMFAADPFAALERISAMMDQQAAAMLRQVQALTTAPADMMPGLPPGASGYTYVSTMSGNGVCMRSVRITYNGNAAPQMVSSTSGNCGPTQDMRPPTEINTPAPATRPSPRTIEVKANGQSPDNNLVRQVAFNR